MLRSTILVSVVREMPSTIDIHLRNRALIAFTLLTGARDGAIASLKLKHVDVEDGRLVQDAREVRTKFYKTLSLALRPMRPLLGCGLMMILPASRLTRTVSFAWSCSCSMKFGGMATIVEPPTDRSLAVRRNRHDLVFPRGR